MDQPILTTVLAAAAGLTSGVIGSLIAPWVHWGIEKKRTLRDSRLELIRDARGYVASEQFRGGSFVDHPIYRRLKPYFERDLVEVIEDYDERQDMQDDPGEFPPAVRQLVLDGIVRIEQMWRLI